MRYESFGVRGVEARVIAWPPLPERYPTGELSKLYSALNSDDSFESCQLRAQLGAVFEGEQWTYDIDSDRVVLTARAFANFIEVKDRFVAMLESSRETLRGTRIFIPDQITVWGLVPDERQRDVGELIRKKLLTRFKTEHYTHLDGEVVGAGMEFVVAGENVKWEVTVAPYLRQPDNLFLYAKGDFAVPDADDWPDEPLDLVRSDLQTAYDFLHQNVVAFAQSLLP